MFKIWAAIAVLSVLLASCACDNPEGESASEANMRILFIGNSHTNNGDVPGTIKRMMESDGSGRRVYVETIPCAFVEDVAKNGNQMALIKNGKWDIVVCQALKLSNSHLNKYPHDGAVEVAKAAAKGGAKAYFFAEWPRKDWDETEYILGEYAPVAKASKATIIPVCRAWDLVLANNKNADLWFSDGNHSSALGAYLACGVIYYWLSDGKGKPTYVPPSVPANSASGMLKVALQTYEKYGKDANSPPKS